MSKRIFIPIRIKLLALSFMLMTLGLMSYLYLTIDLFKKDKQAYIYENQYNLVKYESVVIENYINLLLENASYWVKLKDIDDISKNKLPVVINRDIFSIHIIKNGNPEKIYQKKRIEEPFKSYERLSVVKQPSEKVIQQVENGEIVFRKNGSIASSSIYDLYFLSKKERELVLVRFNGITFDNYEEDSIYHVKKILLRGYEKNTDLTSNISPEKLAYETGTFEDEINNEKYLISFSNVYKSNISLVSLTSLDNAFRSLNLLIKKTLLLAVFIFSIGGVCVIFVSRRLTDPISILVDSATKMTDGDYSQEVKVSTHDEISILANRFNLMASEISKYIYKLEDLVEERTRELKEAHQFLDTMVNSLDEGLFVIDRNQIIQPFYTKACERILLSDSVDGEKADLIFKLNEKNKEIFKTWVDIAFDESIPFKELTNLSISDIEIKKGEIKKHVGLNYYPMRNDSKKIDYIVVVSRDKTHEVQTLEALDEKTQFAEMITRILKNKSLFLTFFTSLKNHLNELKDESKKENIDFYKVKDILHSLRGGLSTFWLKDLENLVVEAEGRLYKDINLYKSFQSEFLSSFENKLIKLTREQLFDFFDTDIFTQSEINTDKQRFINFREKFLPLNDRKLIQDYDNEFIKESVEIIFKGYNEMLQDIAKVQNKKINDIKFLNGGVKITTDKISDFLSVSVHILRNAVCHGVEEVKDRLMNGKSEEGCITIEALHMADKNKFMICFRDDGRGIDVRKIKQKFSSLDSCTDEEIYLKIFEPSFSSKGTIDKFSGAGVGLSSVKDVVDKLNGEIIVTSEQNKGTEISFFFPDKVIE